MTRYGALNFPASFIIALFAVASLVGALVAIGPFATAGLLLAIAGAVTVTLIAAKRPFWILLFLTAYLPFEAVASRYLAVPDRAYQAAQFAGESLIYYMFAIFVLQRVVRGGSFRRTPIDRFLLAFLIVAGISILFNQSPFVGSLLNLRALIRYTLLFYLVVNLDLTPRQVRLLLLTILLVGATQIMIGATQLATRGALNTWLMPRQTEFELAGQSRRFRLLTAGREVGSIFGTLGDTVTFGLFMLVVGSVYLGRINRLTINNILLLVVIVVAVAFSYARAVTVGMLLILLVSCLARYGTRRFLVPLTILIPIAVIGAIMAANIIATSSQYTNPVFERQSVVQNITNVLSQRYVEIAKRQRLGALIGVAPTTLLNRPILGYGPDTQTAIEGINNSSPSYLQQPVIAQGFKDVYWVALLSYYGVVGVALIGAVLYRLYKSANYIRWHARERLTVGVSVAVMCMTAVTAFLLFFNQALEFRVFGFYFWLLAGLMYNLWTREARFYRA